MDLFADRQLKKAINDIIFHKEDLLKDHKLLFPQDVKNAIRNYGLPFVLETVENAVVELADENWFENKYPPTIFKEKKEIRRYKTNDKIKDLINTKVKITDVAKEYGLDTDKKGITTCPFHNDSSPSLHLSNSKNVFHCFGCGAKGDIITFKKKMEEIKEDGNTKGS